MKQISGEAKSPWTPPPAGTPASFPIRDRDTQSARLNLALQTARFVAATPTSGGSSCCRLSGDPGAPAAGLSLKVYVYPTGARPQPGTLRRRTAPGRQAPPPLPVRRLHWLTGLCIYKIGDQEPNLHTARTYFGVGGARAEPGCAQSRGGAGRRLGACLGRSRVARRTAGGEGWCGAGLAAGVPGGRRHEHGGPCPRGSVCPEARSDREVRPDGPGAVGAPRRLAGASEAGAGARGGAGAGGVGWACSVLLRARGVGRSGAGGVDVRGDRGLAAPLTRPRAGRGATKPVAGAGVRGGRPSALRLHGVSLDRPGPQQPQGALGPARRAPGGRGARGPGPAGVPGRWLLRGRCLHSLPSCPWSNTP